MHCIANTPFTRSSWLDELDEPALFARRLLDRVNGVQVDGCIICRCRTDIFFSSTSV